jgi:cardiolipin synthase
MLTERVGRGYRHLLAAGVHTMLILLIVLILIGFTAIPHVLLSAKRPISKLIWIGAILVFPGAGLLGYLLIGNDRVRRRRFRRRSRQFQEVDSDRKSDNGAAPLEPMDRRLLKAVSRLGNHPVTTAHHIEAYYNGLDYYTDLILAIEAARDFIHLEVYVWRGDGTGQRVLKALTEAAGRGVKVRLLVDEIGSIKTNEGFFAPLVRAGGRFSWFYTFHPRRNRYFFNLRNHRKLQIIDGRLAYVGGINIGGEYEGRDPLMGYWKDLQIRVEGDVVDHLQDVFRQDWYYATEEKLPAVRNRQPAGPKTSCAAVVVESGPDTDTRVALNSLLCIIGQATESVELFTPYFVPASALVSALQIAAARAVRVRLMVSKKNDFQLLVDVGRSFYDELLHADVDIYEYDRAMHHSKLVVIDHKWVLAGSANLDARSMSLNFELGILFRSDELCQKLAAHFEGLFAQAQRIDPVRFARRSTYHRLRQGVLGLWAPLL